MAVQNFHVVATIDGRSTSLTGGPRSKTGGMLVKILHRDNGAICKAAEISCVGAADGTLTIEIKAAGHDPIIVESKR